MKGAQDSDEAFVVELEEFKRLIGLTDGAITPRSVPRGQVSDQQALILEELGIDAPKSKQGVSPTPKKRKVDLQNLSYANRQMRRRMEQLEAENRALKAKLAGKPETSGNVRPSDLLYGVSKFGVEVGQKVRELDPYYEEAPTLPPALPSRRRPPKRSAPKRKGEKKPDDLHESLYGDLFPSLPTDAPREAVSEENRWSGLRADMEPAIIDRREPEPSERYSDLEDDQATSSADPVTIEPSNRFRVLEEE